MGDASVLIAAQSGCPTCTRRLQGHKAFALFVAQQQRSRSGSEAVTATAASDARARPRANRMLATVAAALQRQHHENVIHHRLQPQNPAAAHLLRDDWRVGAGGSEAATQSTDDRVSFQEGIMVQQDYNRTTAKCGVSMIGAAPAAAAVNTADDPDRRAVG